MSSNYQLFKELKYGMMIHWGLYSLPAGEWDGQRGSAYAEWIQSRFRIPKQEYEKLATAFNPVFFDAEKIVSLAAECGMKYLVVTTKHHDGFAMYRSRVDSYNVYDATPFHRDVLAELADACRKYGVKLGLYYSQDLDWHEHDGGGYGITSKNSGTTWNNSWDFTGEMHYERCFERKIIPQIKEIMSGYGEIFSVWFDTPMTINAEQSERIYKTVKELQPDCLINSRLGNGKYDYVSFGDNEIPETLEASEGQVDYNSFNGIKPSPHGLYETAATINNTWGFSSFDHNWKSPETIFHTKRRLNALGINYLLNVGPDGLGRIPAESVRILREVAAMERQLSDQTK